MRVVGIILIVLGVVALVFQGFTYTRDRQVVDVGPLEASVEEERTVPIPPIIGGVLLIAGVALVVVGGRQPR